MVKTTKIFVTAIAGVAATVAVSATAHADTGYQQFASPSGNIHCLMQNMTDPITSTPIAKCQIADVTYVVPADVPMNENTGKTCAAENTPGGRDFMLEQGKPGFLRCDYSQLGGAGPVSWPTLDYGQTKSFGTLTCDSETSGVTCTDTSTGHWRAECRRSPPGGPMAGVLFVM
jgi:hypothetical protein